MVPLWPVGPGCWVQIINNYENRPSSPRKNPVYATGPTILLTISLIVPTPGLTAESLCACAEPPLAGMTAVEALPTTCLLVWEPGPSAGGLCACAEPPLAGMTGGRGPGPGCSPPAACRCVQTSAFCSPRLNKMYWLGAKNTVSRDRLRAKTWDGLSFCYTKYRLRKWFHFPSPKQIVLQFCQ